MDAGRTVIVLEDEFQLNHLLRTNGGEDKSVADVYLLKDAELQECCRNDQRFSPQELKNLDACRPKANSLLMAKSDGKFETLLPIAQTGIESVMDRLEKDAQVAEAHAIQAALIQAGAKCVHIRVVFEESKESNAKSNLDVAGNGGYGVASGSGKVGIEKSNKHHTQQSMEVIEDYSCENPHIDLGKARQLWKGQELSNYDKMEAIFRQVECGKLPELRMSVEGTCSKNVVDCAKSQVEGTFQYLKIDAKVSCSYKTICTETQQKKMKFAIAVSWKSTDFDFER